MSSRKHTWVVRRCFRQTRLRTGRPTSRTFHIPLIAATVLGANPAQLRSAAGPPLPSPVAEVSALEMAAPSPPPVTAAQDTLPKITLAVARDTVIGGVEGFGVRLTREGLLSESLRVTVRIDQDQDWFTLNTFDLTFRPGRRTTGRSYSADFFSSSATTGGTITATVDSIGGYDTSEASAAAHVIFQGTPSIDLSYGETPYMFAEGARDTAVTVVARMSPGMPFGATFTIGIYYELVSEAELFEDFLPVNEFVSMEREDYALEDGRWTARYLVPVRIVDDNVHEGPERFLLELYTGAPDQRIIRLLNADGSSCGDPCFGPVVVTDDEDVPSLALSLSTEHIRERDQSSATATVSSTNGKTFATGQVVTFTFSGSATLGTDYTVAPADADGVEPGHQVTLPTGAASVRVTLTAASDAVDDPGEEIEITATHGGDPIGGGTVHVMDRDELVGVDVALDGLDPPQDPNHAGTAVGPFTMRFIFSEEVEGFTQSDIGWATAAGTTDDGTPIGVLLSDFTQVRPGREYTVRITPTKSGVLDIFVNSGAATSAATGVQSVYTIDRVKIDLPDNAVIVSQTSVTVDEEDEDGAMLWLLLTTEPTDTVIVSVSGTEGTTVGVQSQPGLTFTTSNPEVRELTITAGDDANAANETVTVTFTASGGGYDGQAATIVVTVLDNDAVGSSDVQNLDELLPLVDNVSPENASEALFGDERLTGAQLEALDLLGNANGRYDLGDLLSWIARCRRGEANCGRTGPASGGGAPLPSSTKLLGGRKGRSGRRGRGSPELGGSQAGGPQQPLTARESAEPPGVKAPAGERQAGTVRRWVCGFILAGVAVGWGCTTNDHPVDSGTAGTKTEDSGPGALQVRLATPPGVRDLGALLVVEGPAIDSLRAPGLELIEEDEPSADQRRVIVAGALSGESVLQVWVSDLAEHARYRVRLLEVVGEDYALGNVAEYRVVISR